MLNCDRSKGRDVIGGRTQMLTKPLGRYTSLSKLIIPAIDGEQTNLIVTGHRPSKLAPKPICYSDQILKQLVRLCLAYFEVIEPKRVTSGMALGVDMAAAIAALKLGIELICAIPCEGQESRWPERSQKRYHQILRAAERKGGSVHLVTAGKYSVAKMLKRDRWMVKRGNLVFTIYNGSNGGTGHTVAYAKKLKRPIINAWDDWKNRWNNFHPEL